MAQTSAANIASLTALAMLAFAGNSVINRVALAQGEADALTYTGVRLVSGALAMIPREGPDAHSVLSSK